MAHRNAVDTAEVGPAPEVPRFVFISSSLVHTCGLREDGMPNLLAGLPEPPDPWRPDATLDRERLVSISGGASDAYGSPRQWTTGVLDAQEWRRR